MRRRPRGFRRAVVTGGGGCVGSHLCERLLQRGVSVVCVDSFAGASPYNIAHLLGRPGFRCVAADAGARPAIAGPVDLVVHIASAGGRAAGRADHSPGRASAYALGLAGAHGARLVLVQPAGTRGAAGDTPPAPRAAGGNADRARVRLFGAYGPGWDGAEVISRFVTQAVRGDPIMVAGDAGRSMATCYVADAVRAILALAYSDAREAFDVGGSQVRVDHLAELVRALAGSTSPVVRVPGPAANGAAVAPDLDRTWAGLGWRPYVSLEEGLRRTIGWHVRTGAEAWTVGRLDRSAAGTG